MSSDTHAQQSKVVDIALNDVDDVDVDDQENKDINCSVLLSNQIPPDPVISEVSLGHDKPQTSEVVSKKHQEISEQLKHLKQQLKGACSSSPVSSLARDRSATIIQRKWVQFKSFRNKLRYTQHGKWTSCQSDMVFALVLGYRVRYLLKSIAVSLNIKAQRDVIQLLSDMYFSSVGKGVQYTTWEFIDTLLRGNDETVDDLLVLNPSLSHSDLMLAKSLSKQLLLERQRLHRLLFQCCPWVPTGPSPGYWDLSAPILVALSATKSSSSSSSSGRSSSSHVFSPSRKLPRSPAKSETETPPSLRLAMNHAKQASKLQPLNLYANKHHHHHHHSASALDAVAMRPFPLKDFPASAAASAGSDASIEGSFSEQQRERSVPAIMTPECGRDARRTASSSNTDSGGGGALKRSSAVQTAVLRSARCRSRGSIDSCKGHVQLDVLSAERLMAAKKVRVIGGACLPSIRSIDRSKSHRSASLLLQLVLCYPCCAVLL